MSTIALIDELLEKPKRLAAPPLWKVSPHSEQQARMKAALEIEGEIRGSLSFIANATLYLGNHLQIQLVLSYNDHQIERLAINPHEEHTNKRFEGISKKLWYIVLPAGQNRYYSWKSNKGIGFPPPEKYLKNLPAAEPLEQPIADFSEAVNYFFTRTNIELLDISNPPLLQSRFL